MATLHSLKNRLRDEAKALSVIPQLLSNDQYRAGHDILTQGLGKLNYDKFIVPQLSQLLRRFESQNKISVLEIGPGPKSVLAQLPYHIRQSIANYATYEPNDIFATQLEISLSGSSEGHPSLPCLEEQADIRRIPFTANKNSTRGLETDIYNELYDVILFCHSMYGMNPKKDHLEKALDMLAGGGMIIVFHRGEGLFIENMVCHRTAYYPMGKISLENHDAQLDYFASFIAGFCPQDTDASQEIALRWRRICREMGLTNMEIQDRLYFSAPEVMLAFNKNATSLSDLVTKVPVVERKIIKNRDARLQRSAAHVAPRDIKDVQHCVRWALDNKVELTVLSGSHSDHCIRSNVVVVDMASFGETNIVQLDDGPEQGPEQLVIAGCGCKTDEIVRKSLEKGLMVPLGARPSIGSGLWLQGGFGHLTRRYGLTCDAIVGAVLVTVDTGQAVYAGIVPHCCRPSEAVRATNEAELLWGLKGAGTNFAIVTHVIFKTFPADMSSVRSWSYAAKSRTEAQQELSLFEESVTKKLTTSCSADVYLHCNGGELLLGGTFFDSQKGRTKTSIPWPMNKHFTADSNWCDRDAIELFNADLYMTAINGGHESGKTFSFKRCVFLQDIGDKSRAALLVGALESRPSDLCYLHLVHGGGAANDVASEDASFGCRDWSYACVITAVWLREKDDSCAASDAKRWVYSVVKALLPLSTGIYGADLGPDPRDVMLAQRAFGPNLARLSRLKKASDPFGVLAYACPLPKKVIEQKLLITVTGESCAGKDYCADIWASALAMHHITVRVASISDVTKTEYARATGADLHRLFNDRAYKELHRGSLTEFFQSQVQQRPQLPEEHFQAVVDEAADVDALLITGMRDVGPVAAFSHLASRKKLIEVNVTASKDVRQSRKLYSEGDNEESSVTVCGDDQDGFLGPVGSGHCPDFVFDNTAVGEDEAVAFAETRLVPLLSDYLKQLADMIPTVPDFPRLGIKFRHILSIPQHPGGLALCTSLLRSCFDGWEEISAIACCEAGSYIFAAALAVQVGVPLVTIRKGGKLPPPTISVPKSPSHISSLSGEGGERIEMDPRTISPTASVVVVDDVLATGRTLLATLQLLKEMAIDPENITVLIVAEFPMHRGRALLRQNGFGRVRVQSVLVFSGD